MKHPAKIAFLTNFIPPFFVPTLSRLRDLTGALEIFVSTAMEFNRQWKPFFGDLQVTIQRGLTRTAVWKHENGFTEAFALHFPIDTIPQLWRCHPHVTISAQLGLRTAQAAFYRRVLGRGKLVIWTGLSKETEKGRSPFVVALRKVLLRMADAVTANGASAEEYLTALGVSSEKLFRVPYCLDMAPYLELPLEREPYAEQRLLYVGQLVHRKGLIPFLSLLAGWLQQNPQRRCEIWVTGEGPLRESLESLPVPNQLQIRLLGAVPYERLSEVYGRCGILVFPTLADEWGMVVNEGLAAGLPVLGSIHSQAVADLVEEGITGWTYSPDHPGEMLAALNRAMTAGQDQLHIMRTACRKRVITYTPEFAAKCFLSAIEYVLGKGTRDSATEKSSLDPGLQDTNFEGSV
jgi:glycosyltransferase involved in cell wall biosynthesis